MKMYRMTDTPSFEEWYNEIADMPERAADGTWYDLETGLPWLPVKEKRVVKTADDIRSEKLAECESEEDREYLANNQLSRYDCVWKRFKSVKVAYILKQYRKHDDMMRAEQEAHAAGDAETRDSIRAVRRKMRRSWGIY